MAMEYIYNLGEAFCQIASRHPSRTALSYPSGAVVTYGYLNLLSNSIAGAFSELGIGRGDVVCIFNNKSVQALASMIACLKLGAIYANLDISSPWARIQKMLETCRAALVLYEHIESEVVAKLEKAEGLRALDLHGQEFGDRLACHAGDDFRVGDSVIGSDPAYLMFTSGSTGFPKAAVMSHANVLNFVRWGQTTLNVSEEDVFTNVNPIYFDNSVFDFYVSLFSGATVCPVTVDITGEPRRLVETVNRLKCTIWFSVPSLLVYLLTTKSLQQGDLPYLTRIVFGGEGFPKSKLAELYRLFSDRAHLVNVYGPTECTCICSSYVITREDVEEQTQLAPLGHVAPNFGYSIEPVDDQDPDFGELLLYGPNVGLGYFNDIERTRSSFVEVLSNGDLRRVMYRTGDLVRRAANGQLHFQGRVDNQIKHMGYRIELEEVEAAFSSLGGIDEVGVVYHRGVNGLGEIIAFVTSSESVTEKAITNRIKKILPAYMVPKRVNLMDSLPKNRNGKIDRAQLRTLVSR